MAVAEPIVGAQALPQVTARRRSSGVQSWEPRVVSSRAALTAVGRKRLKPSDFAGPDETYPIHDHSHGEAAISLGAKAVNAGTLSASEYAKIKAKVHARYPDIGAGDSK